MKKNMSKSIFVLHPRKPVSVKLLNGHAHTHTHTPHNLLTDDTKRDLAVSFTEMQKLDFFFPLLVQNPLYLRMQTVNQYPRLKGDISTTVHPGASQDLRTVLFLSNV